MSLVLEALKKLDREKGRDQRGFLVMAAAPWPTRAARRWPAWAAVAVAAAGALTAVALLRAQRAPVPAVPIPAAPVSVAPAAPAATVAAPSAVRSVAPRRSEVRKPPLDRDGVGGAGDTEAAAGPPAGPTLPAAVARPAATPTPGPDHGLRLQAVSERDGQPIAIVNDRLVRVGDEVGGMRVLAIRPTEVDVDLKGRRITIAF